MSYNWEKIFKSKTDHELHQIYIGKTNLNSEAIEFAETELKHRNIDLSNIEKYLYDKEHNFKIPENSPELSIKDIYFRIWISPRIVFKYLNDYRYNKQIDKLLILTGAALGIQEAINRNTGDDFQLLIVLSIAILLGGLFTWLSSYIYAELLSWTGGWLNGKGNGKSLIRPIAYSRIPYLCILLIDIFLILILGNEVFQSHTHSFQMKYEYLILIYYAIFIIAYVWSKVLLIIGVSEVQKFSIWKSILNVILPVLVFTIPLGIIALIGFVLGDLLK